MGKAHPDPVGGVAVSPLDSLTQQTAISDFMGRGRDAVQAALPAVGQFMFEMTPPGMVQAYERDRSAGAYGPALLAALPGGIAAKKGLGAILKEAAESRAKAVKPIRGYHGSPHDFDKFDMSKIGMGEGTQMEGRGLYIADTERAAKFYRDSTPKELAARVANAAAGGKLHPQQQVQLVDQVFDIAKKEGVKALDEYEAPKGFETAWNAVVADLRSRGRVRGRMYEVDIAASPDDFIDRNKTVGQQSPQVRDALYRVANDVDVGVDRINDEMRIVEIRKLLENEGSVNKLRDHAVAGIRYADANAGISGDNTLNYVVFDDKLISIARKYGWAGAAATLGISQADLADAAEQQGVRGVPPAPEKSLGDILSRAKKDR